MLETFTVETFSGRLGEVFNVAVGDGSRFEAQLVGAESVGPAVPGAREPFSLVFQRPAGSHSSVVLPQAIYAVTHPEIGAFELFLVPLGPDVDGMRYEAAFG